MDSDQNSTSTSSGKDATQRLLLQVSTLRNELNDERRRYVTERKKGDDQHQVDLRLVREASRVVEARLKMLQEKYRDDITDVTSKLEGMVGDWSVLQTRARALETAVDALFNAPLQDVRSVTDEVQEGVVGKGDEWEVQKTHLFQDPRLLQQGTAAQRTQRSQRVQGQLDDKRSYYQERIDSLLQRNNELEVIQGQHKAEIHSLQLRDTAYLNLLKELEHGNKHLEAYVRLQSQLLLKTNDISLLDDPKTVQPNSSGAIDTNAVSLDASEMLRSPTSKSVKRTFSELADDEHEAPSVDRQRRRTGFGSYVGLSNPAWQHGAIFTTGRNGFASAQGDFQSGSGLEALSTTAESSPSQLARPDVASTNGMDAAMLDFSTTKLPFEMPSTQPRPLVLLPSTPTKGYYRSPDGISESSDEEKSHAKVFQFRSNWEKQSLRKAPLGPSKWPNSMLRKAPLGPKRWRDSTLRKDL